MEQRAEECIPSENLPANTFHPVSTDELVKILNKNLIISDKKQLPPEYMKSLESQEDDQLQLRYSRVSAVWPDLKHVIFPLDFSLPFLIPFYTFTYPKGYGAASSKELKTW